MTNDDVFSGCCRAFIVGCAKRSVAGRYRYLQPIYIQEGCLKCHGDPKGELDIAGRPKEGYRVGDFRGAISVSIAVTH